MTHPVVVYTDGGCIPNPGPGGWAWMTTTGLTGQGNELATTNQRMEIMAAYQAVLTLGGEVPLEVVSDSTYVVKCFTERWYLRWRKNGWHTSKKQPVVNRVLWEPFVDLVDQLGNVTFRWVKGHGTDPMNIAVDKLANRQTREAAAALADA